MSTIQLRTQIPARNLRPCPSAAPKPYPAAFLTGTPIYVAKAEDAWLEDVDGNRYLDFAGGIGCANAGHRQDEVVEAVKDQLDHFMHTCVQVTPYETYVRLAERDERSHARQIREEDHLREQRRRGRRERGQDRPRLHPSAPASSPLKTPSTAAP